MSDWRMDRHKFSLLGLALAFFHWFAESVIHRFVYAEEFFEIVPSDVNEFWMRLSIIVRGRGIRRFCRQSGAKDQGVREREAGSLRRNRAFDAAHPE